MQQVRIRARVVGSVQGVGFRMNTRAVALRLGLAGTAVNQPDGSVVVEAEGDPDRVRELVDWLWTGPRYASVDDVALEQLAPTGSTEFSVS